jgi:hypothetical protein
LPATAKSAGRKELDEQDVATVADASEAWRKRLKVSACESNHSSPLRCFEQPCWLVPGDQALLALVRLLTMPCTFIRVIHALIRIIHTLFRIIHTLFRIIHALIRVLRTRIRVLRTRIRIIGTAFPNEPQETVGRLVAANEARGAPTVAQPARVRVRKGGASFFFCCVCGCVRPASAASAGCSVCVT